MDVGNQFVNSKFFLSDSDSGINNKRNYVNDLDYNLELSILYYRRRLKGYDYYRNFRYVRGNLRSRLDWEKNNFKVKVIFYVYVNYNYVERVRQKLNFQSLMEVKNYWGFLSMEEDLILSLGDEVCFDYNVWVL